MQGRCAGEGGVRVEMLEALLCTGIRISIAGTRVVTVAFGVLEKGHNSLLHLRDRRFSPHSPGSAVDPLRHGGVFMMMMVVSIVEGINAVTLGEHGVLLGVGKRPAI